MLVKLVGFLLSTSPSVVSCAFSSMQFSVDRIEALAEQATTQTLIE